MQVRKQPLVNNHYYHIYSRSIARYVIFNDTEDFSRFIEILNLYRFQNCKHKFNRFASYSLVRQKSIMTNLEKTSLVLVDIVAYSIMPTHIHLILKQVLKGGISNFISRVLNSYSRYFNLKHNRIGPLWAGRFKSVLVENDEQLLHLTRYLHLNPTSANLVKNPQDWLFSSYGEYIDSEIGSSKFCTFRDIMDFSPQKYKHFVEDRKDYQRSLSIIKNLVIDDCTG